MKKKILLLVCLLLITFNVKALTFNVNLTNIEDKQSGTLGTIDNIDLDKQELDASFQSSGDEINFELTITNSGNRAGTLKSITVSSDSKLVDYTNNLPENGLAIDGGGINKVLINGKLKDGVTSGNGKSKLTIKYDYEEGSCPEGEILSEDETECLCPEGYERNDEGICVKPETNVTCADDEIYNSTKKICEKKEVIPTPKTGDNIILITLLFILAGLALYAFLFKKFKTGKARRTFGIVTAIATFSASILVLITVFGVDGLLGAVINPIQRQKEIYVTVNENVDFIEVWDGTCSLTTSELTPEKIFEGGVGTESNPYQIKTANQLACFAASINNGTTYEGKFVKQIKNIKLNENLNDQVTAGDLSNAHVWTAAGNTSMYFDDDLWDHVLVTENYFAGTYDGDNYIISGLYLTNDSNGQYTDSWNNLHHDYKGLFGVAIGATVKNLTFADTYMNSSGANDGNMASLIGFSKNSLIVSNVKIYGDAILSGNCGGVIGSANGNGQGELKLENIENNINIYFTDSYYLSGGLIGSATGFPNSESQNIILRNVRNKGDIDISSTSSAEMGGVVGNISNTGNLLFDNVSNEGDFVYESGSKIGGVAGYISVNKAEIKNSYNSGNFSQPETLTNPRFFTESSTYIGSMGATNGFTVDNCYNSGDVSVRVVSHNIYSPGSRFGGLIGYQTGGDYTISNSYNTGDLYTNTIYLGGIVGDCRNSLEANIINCYNLGDITGISSTGGIASQTGEVRNSYNKGKITLNGGGGVGGISGSRVDLVSNSYNTGDIIIPRENTNGYAYAGGICSSYGGCGRVENSYNRGNIISSKSYYLGGIGYQVGSIKNVYNSGNITFLSEDSSPYAEIGGIDSSSGSGVSNAYNLGNIIVHQSESDNSVWPYATMSGIARGGDVYDSVNTGNITLIMDAPYIRTHEITMLGIVAHGRAYNCFNAGNITIDDSSLQQSIIQDEFSGNKHQIYLGEITSEHDSTDQYYTSSNNKFNTNANNLSLGCLYSINNDLAIPSYAVAACTTANSNAIGSYTTEAAPDILSIINGDNAFEIKPGETLPTLKVFNN